MRKYLLTTGVATLVVLGVLISNFGRKTAGAVTYDQAKEALTMMKEWATWITGIQVGAIAAIGYFAKPGMRHRQKTAAFFAVLFFGGSILLATWLLSGFPSIVERLDTSGNAVLTNDIFQVWVFSFIPIRVGLITSLQHYLFVLGSVCFFVFVLMRFEKEQGESQQVAPAGERQPLSVDRRRR